MRPYSPLTATMALLRSSHGVLSRTLQFFLAILCALTALSRRSHCKHCAFTAFALRFHGVCTALSRPWRVEGAVASQSKEEGKDQESMQLIPHLTKTL